MSSSPVRSTIQRIVTQRSDRPKEQLCIITPGRTVYLFRAQRMLREQGIECWRAPIPDEINDCHCLIGLEFPVEDFEQVKALIDTQDLPRVKVHRYTDFMGNDR